MTVVLQALDYLAGKTPLHFREGPVQPVDQLVCLFERDAERRADTDPVVSASQDEAFGFKGFRKTVPKLERP